MIQVHVPYDRLNEHLQMLVSHRINPELYFKAQDIDCITLDDIHALAEALVYKPTYTFHAPFFDLCPSAVDDKIRQVTLQRFHRVLDYAEILKPKCIVFHPGYEKYKYGLETTLWLKQSVLTWKEINERAKSLSVRVAIENIFEEEPSTLKMLVHAIADDNFGICFDTGHFNIFSKTPLTVWLSELKPFVFELHLHDNDTTSDQHLPIKKGCFDFETLFACLKDKSCIYTLEAHSAEDALLSLQNLKAFIN